MHCMSERMVDVGRGASNIGALISLHGREMSSGGELAPWVVGSRDESEWGDDDEREEMGIDWPWVRKS